MNDILTTMVSIPFAMAVTALLRKKWPQIDGAYVPIVVLVLATLAGLIGFYRDRIPTEVWAGLGPLLAAITALGADSYVSNKISVGSTSSSTGGSNIDSKTEVRQDWGKESPTKKDLK